MTVFDRPSASELLDAVIDFINAETKSEDFPANKRVLDLLDELDKITLKYEGRFYLAKDARMTKDTFKVSDKRIENFIEFRNKNNFLKKFKSSQSLRLEL